MVEKPAAVWQRAYSALALPKLWAIGSKTEQPKQHRPSWLPVTRWQFSVEGRARLLGKHAIDASVRLD
jgi:hypothetical protein